MARQTPDPFASRRSRPTLVLVAIIAAALAAALLFLGPLAGPVRAPSVKAADRDAIVDFLAPLLRAAGNAVEVNGEIVKIDDDPDPTWPFPNADTLNASYAALPMVPDTLLDRGFPCDSEMVACSSFGSDAAAFANGALLVQQELAEPVRADPTKRVEYGVLALIDKFPPIPVGSDGQPTAFTGGSHLFVARWDLGAKGDVFLLIYGNGQMDMFRTHARAVISGNDVFMLIPFDKEWMNVTAWDTYAYESSGTPETTGRDVSRGTFSDPLLMYVPPGTLTFPLAEATATPTVEPTATPTVEPTATPTEAPPPEPTATPDPGTASDGGGLLGLPLAGLGLGALLVLIALWLLLKGRGKKDEPPPVVPPPDGPKPEPPPDEPKPEEPKPEEPKPEEPTPPDGPDVPPPVPVGPGGPIMPGTPQEPGPIPPPPGPVPPPPPPPPAKACDDGDEEWRNDKAPATFLVPPADGKVAITSDPTTPALDAWLAEFGFPRGAPMDRFVAVDDEALDVLLADLSTEPGTIQWVIEFTLDEYRMVCQRKWVCQNEVYVPTDDLRLDESGPDPYLGRYVVDGPTRTRDDVRRIWADAQKALVAAESAVSGMDAYRRDCA